MIVRMQVISDCVVLWVLDISQPCIVFVAYKILSAAALFSPLALFYDQTSWLPLFAAAFSFVLTYDMTIYTGTSFGRSAQVA
jgi:hypothetical protein